MTEQHPRYSTQLFGHEAQELRLLAEAAGGKLPHGLILFGIKGIGKATLAYRLARELLAAGNANADTVYSRVAAGSHSDLLVIEPEFDEKKGEYAKDINVEQAREIAKFLAMTPAESRWRVVIIDAADALNTNAANAILKILEEPPAQAVLLLISHQPSLLLPTIRSRCQMVKLAPLTPDEFRHAANTLLPEADEQKLSALAQLTGGAPGKALDYEEQGALAIYDELLLLLANLPVIDPSALHGFADRMTSEKPHERWKLLTELVLFLFERVTKYGSSVEPEGITSREPEVLETLAALHKPHIWAAKWQQAADHFSLASRLHLDYKQLIITFFHSIINKESQFLVAS